MSSLGLTSALHVTTWVEDDAEVEIDHNGRHYRVEASTREQSRVLDLWLSPVAATTLRDLLTAALEEGPQP